jgi:hypothetical protein
MRTLESGSAGTDTTGVRQYEVTLTTMPNARSARTAPPTKRAERAIFPRRGGDAAGADFSLVFAKAIVDFDGLCFFLGLNAI